MSLIANLQEEVTATDGESDYVAVELLWNVLVKAAHAKNHSDEFGRLKLFVADLTAEQAASWLQQPGVDTLLDLDPPIETVISHHRERMQPVKAAEELTTIRADRATDPKTAAQALLSLLKRIRNKRIHGFKTPKGPRDTPILGAARQLLRELCHLLVL